MSHSNAYYSKYSKKQYCPVRCSTDVELDLDVKPKVACRELSRRGTEFDIELDFEVNHNCKLIPKKTYKDECGCVTKCVFGVQLDFDCIPRVRHNPCSKPSAQFELDVELDVSPHCKPIEDCKVRYYKYDQKNQKYNKDDKEDEDDIQKLYERKEDKIERKQDDKSYDKSDIDCDCDVCKPTKKEEDFSLCEERKIDRKEIGNKIDRKEIRNKIDRKEIENKKSYWL